MPSAATIIADALGLLGVTDPVEDLEPEDTALGLRVLNRLVSGLNTQQSMLYVVEYLSFTLPAGIASRTIGPSGADITQARPGRVELGGYASVGGVDYPLSVWNREQYGEICLKALGNVAPDGVYYEAGSPNGRLYFWPVTGSAATIKLPLATKLTAFADAVTNYTLPDGYEDMLVHNLAIKVASFYQTQPAPSVVSEARRLKRQIKLLNVQTPMLDTDLPIPVSYGPAGSAEAFKSL